MSVVYEDDCNDCYNCIGKGCQFYGKTTHYYCDTCGDEYNPDDLYEDYENGDGDMICEACILERYNKVSVE